MYIEKRANGKYRISQAYNGIRYRVTVDHKPTKFEAQQLITEKINASANTTVDGRNTFYKAAEGYIASKCNILSPSTIKGYRDLLHALPDNFKKETVGELASPNVIQKFINEYSKTHSAKTIKNIYGFISPVMKYAVPGLSLTVTLPQVQREETYIPEDEDVKRLITALKGTEFEIPVMLASFGLRRSEICALDTSDFDFDNNSIYVHKTMLNDGSGYKVYNRNKTSSSVRTVYLPKMICDAVKEKGYVYNGNPEVITNHMRRELKKLGIDNFSLHKLRHYYASMASTLGMPESYILDQGGWSTPSVMKSVYRHAQKDKKKEIAQIAISHLENMFSESN